MLSKCLFGSLKLTKNADLISKISDSAIIFDEVINAQTDAEAKSNDKTTLCNEETEMVPTNFNKNKATCKDETFMFY